MLDECNTEKISIRQYKVSRHIDIQGYERHWMVPLTHISCSVIFKHCVRSGTALPSLL